MRTKGTRENGYNFTCECPLGWTGRLCTDDINRMSSGRCTNGGLCSNENGSYYCMCPTSEGNNTVSLMDEVCTHGMCIDGYGSDISCNCTYGFTGLVCDQDDTNITFCNNNTCVNGGTCIEDRLTVCNCAFQDSVDQPAPLI